MENNETQQLTWKEHIRKRPAMFVGNLSITGFKKILEYFFEELMSDSLSNPTFEIKFYQSNRLEFKLSNIDSQKIISRIEELKLHKEGLKSFGLAILLSINSNISIAINDLNYQLIVKGKRGHFETEILDSFSEEKNIIIDYTLDNEIFKNFIVNYDHINDFLKQFAFLNPGLKIISIDKTTDELQRNIFFYPSGIFEQLDLIISQLSFGIPSFKLNIEKEVENFSYKIGLCYTSIWSDKFLIRSFAGNVETYLGGSFHDGILDGLVASIKHIAEKENCKINISKKIAKENLILIAALRGENLVFEGCTKIKLGMPKIRNEVKKIVFNELVTHFESSPSVKEGMLNKFRRWD